MWSFVVGFFHLASVFRFFHIVEYVGTSLLFIMEEYSNVWTPHFVYHYLVDEHLRCFYFLATMNNRT